MGTKVRGSKVRLPRLLKLYCRTREETAGYTPLSAVNGWASPTKPGAPQRNVFMGADHQTPGHHLHTRHAVQITPLATARGRISEFQTAVLSAPARQAHKATICYDGKAGTGQDSVWTWEISGLGS